MNEIQWQQTSYYNLTNKQIVIWYIDIYDHCSYIDDYRKILSNEECIRAGRFRFDRDRNCFIVSRASLKLLLSLYLNCSLQDITFQTNQYGKPSIILSNQLIPICFNLSHSGYRTLIAIARDQEIGIDIEYMQEKMAMDEIAERCFSHREYEEYRKLPKCQKFHSFYHIWTRKEAFIKAMGQGMSYPLKQFDVSLNPNEEARLISIEGDKSKVLGWHLYGFIPEKNYCAAISWKGVKKQLLFYSGCFLAEKLKKCESTKAI